jgi:transcriptional regulator with XRE-family HTH domain
MAKLAPTIIPVPTLVGERLRTWGMCVRKQRIAQRIRADDLCSRLAISRPTLLRLERGEATVNVAAYLAALHILGALDRAAPALAPDLWQMSISNGRARPDSADDDDYF